MMESLKMLIVDDNEFITRLHSAFFSFKGHEIITVNSVKRALREIVANTFDIVLSDIVMPKIDGITLLIQSKKITPKTPFVLISALGDQAALIKLAEKHCVDLIMLKDDLHAIEKDIYKLTRKKI